MRYFILWVYMIIMPIFAGFMVYSYFEVVQHWMLLFMAGVSCYVEWLVVNIYLLKKQEDNV